MYDLAAEGITTEREFVIRIANGLRPPLTDACLPEWRTLIEVSPCCWCVSAVAFGWLFCLFVPVELASPNTLLLLDFWSG